MAQTNSELAGRNWKDAEITTEAALCTCFGWEGLYRQEWIQQTSDRVSVEGFMEKD